MTKSQLGHLYNILTLFALVLAAHGCTDKVSLADNGTLSDWANTLETTVAASDGLTEDSAVEPENQSESPAGGDDAAVPTENALDDTLEDTIENLAAAQLAEDEEFLETFVF